MLANLDDISVIQGLLPENGPRKHTLITTRNPNSEGIPAEGLEVSLLNPVDAVDLLSTLSNVAIASDSPEKEQADKIVTELGYLPLAIEQAAAYVREAGGDFLTFLKEYEENHEDVLRWVPRGNRQYTHSVATMWSMSFNIVQKNHALATELFRLLAFLNPNGILIDFLISGAEALEDNGL